MVEVSLKKWQQREIVTFDQVEKKIKLLVESWLNSQEVKEIINKKCEEWLGDPALLEDLNQKTQPICQKFKIDNSGLNLRANIDPNIGNQAIPLKDVIGIEAFKKITDVIADIIGDLLAIGGFIGGILLFLAGNWIWGILAFVITNYAGKAAEVIRQISQEILKASQKTIVDWLKKTDLPIESRKNILPDDKIGTVCEEKKTELATEISEKMSENEAVFKYVVEQVGTELEKALEKRADQATVLIDRYV
ncbi:hypothetical protein [Aetokthonos hydrillicola]|uniref:hypothetical protein n=1 Tax=Aetokthonos hydrillicola TaxID=1550245 RepID=UPI001ABAFE5D